MAWFSVRCVFRNGRTYEERSVLFAAQHIDDALRLAEQEGHEYCEALGDCEFLGFAQAFELSDGSLISGTEIFSLMRDSELHADEYLSRYFDTGTERQSHAIGSDPSQPPGSSGTDPQ